MIAALLLAAQLRQTPVPVVLPKDGGENYAGWTFYTGQTVGWTPMWDIEYTRAIYVWVGPVEHHPFGPPDPPPLEPRDVLINMTILSVPAGEACNPDAIQTKETGSLFGSNCPHGVGHEPEPDGAQ